MTYLQLHRIRKSFGETRVVEDLSLTVEHGECVCLLGPSGCGKTTTLRIIAGFEGVDAGRVILAGEEITLKPPQKRDIGLVFQHYALFPHMTVAENVGFGLRMRRATRAATDEAVRSALALVRLLPLAERYPRQLSGGQQQRVAVARALAIRPRLLLLDEPLSNLDAKLRDEMRDEIKHIQNETGVTTIFVTHDQVEALALADRVAVMSEGRLLQIADPVSIYEAPANVGVGRFIGQVNIFDGKVTGNERSNPVVCSTEGLRLIGQGATANVGNQVTTLVRHERVVLSRERPADAENVFACRIEGRTYLGGMTAYRCVIGNRPLQALIPNNRVFQQFKVGEEIFASWSSADCRVYPA